MPSNMQTIFEQLLTRADKNHMAVNYSKTKEMIMGPPSITVNLSLIKMTTGHTERDNSTKLLGIHLVTSLGNHTSRPSWRRQLNDFTS